MSATAKWEHLQYPVTLVFDSQSILSAKEIKNLKEKDQNNRLQFVDAAEEGFDAEEYGLSDAEAHNGLHLRDAAGNTVAGTDALEAASEAVGAGSFFRYGRGPGMRSGVPYGSYKVL